MRTIAYIDGFNLYYRAIRKLNCKWLDLWSLVEASLPQGHELVRIKYFTAQVHELPDSPGSPERQRIYLAALRNHIPNLDIVHGSFAVHAKCQRVLHPVGALAKRDVLSRGKKAFVADLNHEVHAAKPEWTDDPGPPIHVINMEEKGSDVNVAVHFLNDAWADKADCFALITNDSDLSEAARIVSAELKKKVLLLTPEGTKPSMHLARHVSDKRVIRKATFEKSLLPDPIPNTNIYKPQGW